MTKPLIYIVRTNYNLPKEFSNLGETEIREILEEDPKYFNDPSLFNFKYDKNNEGIKILERVIKEEFNLELFPNIELRRNYAAISFTDRKRHSFSTRDKKIDFIKQLVTLEHPSLNNELPEGYINLIFDYITNLDTNERFFKYLSNNFDLRRFEIMREKVIMN